MKLVRGLLEPIALIAIALVLPAIAMAEPRLETHRVGAKTDDGSGWHLAVSSKGSFSVLLPIPFNDFTPATRHRRDHHVVGGKSPGIKFAASSSHRAASAAGSRLDPENARGNAGQQGVRCHALDKGDADILTLTMANATTTLYMCCIEIKGVRYTLSIEFPNAHRELVAASKDKFFDSFKLKTKS